MLVPLYIVCWRFHAEHAVALSNFTITGGAFANMICNVHRCASIESRQAPESSQVPRTL